jgi:hypothetical protein
VNPDLDLERPKGSPNFEREKKLHVLKRWFFFLEGCGLLLEPGSPSERSKQQLLFNKK